MRKQSQKAFLIVAASSLIFAAIITLRGQGQDVSFAETVAKNRKEHSKLYKEFRGSKKLRETVAQTSRGEVAVINEIPDKVYDPNAPRFDLDNFLSNMSCKADAVIIGTVKDQSSQLTEDEDFIFTDYALTVEQILKNKDGMPLQQNGTIIITRPGGTIQLEGKKVRALDEALEPFQTGGRYLLFLEFIPSTGAYKAFNSRGSFQISNNRILKLTKESLPASLDRSQDSESFVSEIRKAIAVPCDK